MKRTHIKSVSILMTSLFALWGCSDSSDNVSSSEFAQEVERSASKDDLASGLANVQKDAESKIANVQKAAQDQIASAQKKADEQAAQLKAEVAEALAQQKKELLAEMSANTSNLTSQMSGLKEKYDSLKDSLPDEVLKVVKEQIPDLESSVTKIKQMAANFDPNSIEEFNSFKQKYQKEYEVAMSLIKKTSELLASSGINVPKLF